ncbi:MAG: Unknown protein [uncultured Sulfurovum sp.]|uniref:Serine aminopeptidase S33 domain-containing protein n=1 Tax=uncultured Sulfurovum sp. TaxID=269237 RepID=A0A6S6SER6_9BACT|nr:MAG: Unknown protein [uncultured Sulfurovum sp.]
MKKTVFIILFILILLQSIIWVNQENIMHPKKRLLQRYHHEWLDKPWKHGMKIQKHFTQARTPYLLVEEDISQGVSTRQKLLKEQLPTQNINKDAGILVLLHGKNGRKEDLLPVAERYVALGLTCLLVDLPHHGESNLKHLYYTKKKHEQLYVDEVLDDVSKYLKVKEKKLYIWGMSLGGAFAITNVFNSKYDFQAMVLVSTFERLDKVLKEKSLRIFGDFLGTLLYEGLEKSLVFFYNFNPKEVDSTKLAKGLKLPLYMVHGEEDSLIAYEQGEELFSSFNSQQKQFYLDKEGDHHNILITKHQFYKESGLFFTLHSFN